MTINGNIIIVQDNPIERRYYASVLTEHFDCNILTYSSGEEMLDRLKYSHPKILITNYKLDYFNDEPVMCGLQLSRKVKKLCPEVHIIMISKEDNELKDEAIEDWIDSYIVKVDGYIQELKDIVNKLIKKTKPF